MPVSLGRTVEDILASEELFPLQPLPENTAAWSPRQVLANVETLAVQFTGSQEVEKELEDTKREIMK